MFICDEGYFFYNSETYTESDTYNVLYFRHDSILEYDLFYIPNWNITKLITDE